MNAEERAARAGRDRSKSSVPDAALSAWATRAEKLEKLGLRMIEQATKKPTTRTPSNGVQLSAKLSGGLKLLEAADRIWIRLGRVRAPKAASSSGFLKGGTPPSLDDYRQRRPSA